MKKLNNKKGFTLAELLIVVAIIGVLTVVAVPIFTTQLEKSREAADIANMREAKAAAASAYLQDETVPGTTNGNKQLGSAQNGDVTIYFDASKGVLTADVPSPGYGKGTGTVGDQKNTLYGYTPGTAHGDEYIQIVVHQDGSSDLTWTK